MATSSADTDAKHPTVLLSYSHDSQPHEQRVLDLCNRLRTRGVDAFVDQFLPGAPSEGWPLWMERQIETRDFTLVVCTQAYQRRFMENEAQGVGRGVVWEARILRNVLYEDSERHGRIVPVFFEADDRQFVPTVFRGHFYDLSDDRSFESLLRHLLREPGAEASALGSLGPHGSRWSAFERPWLVPDALRTRYFTGRERLLAQLRQQLLARRRAALSGLGGVGKTQTAIEYAVRHRDDYPDGVYWTNAESESGLKSGFVEFAKVLRLAAAASTDQEQIVRAALEWLNGTNRWLLIFDNVDDRRDLRPFVPDRGEGHILVTSRESVFQELGIARAIEAIDLDSAEAVGFLYKRTGREAGESAEIVAAAELASELGNLPLALEQAAAYVAETNANYSDYLASFRKRRVTLLERASGLVSHDTVAVTWSANFEAVERASPGAADVLRIAAFLAPDAIPYELFEKGVQFLGDPIAAALSDPDELAMAELLRSLVRYSLVRSDAQSRTFGVHRLVQEIVREAVAEPTRRLWVQRAVAALDAAFPDVEYATWAQCDRLVPHVIAIARWIDAYDLHAGASGRVLKRTGQALFARGRYAEAEQLFARELAVEERLLGPDHPDVAKCLNALAIVCAERGRYDEAQPLYQRALSIVERALGHDHPDMAKLLNNLGALLLDQGRFAEAKPLHDRAMAIYEPALGPDHLELARVLNNLAIVNMELGLVEKAQPQHERALSIRERALGPEHPDVAYSLDGLANILTNRGRFAEALPLYVRAIAIRERALGSDHSLLATNLHNLGELHRKQGRYDEAKALHERALVIWERALGHDHPFVAWSLYGLAQIHRDQGRAEAALPLFERTLAIQQRRLPSDHPKVVEIRASLDAVRALIDAQAAGNER